MSSGAWEKLRSSLPAAAPADSAPADSAPASSAPADSAVLEPRVAVNQAPALCQQCLLSHIQGLVDADAQGAQAETMMELLNLSEGRVEETGFYVSKPWLVCVSLLSVSCA